MLAWGAGPGAACYRAAREELTAIAQAVRAALAGRDAMLCPTTPHTAFGFDEAMPADQAVFVALASCLGEPATAFPIGQSRNGLPISAQVMAAREATCLAVAGALIVPLPISAARRRPAR